MMRRPQICCGAPWIVGRHRERIDRLSSWWQRSDTAVYAVFCLACTLFAAARFYGYMLVQTGGVWSAPLDDVFIHFDYARSFARGYPFEWSEGNGFSSGNTSLSYPIVLAFGYWIGFQKLDLVIWAAIVACASVFGFLLAAGSLVAPPHDVPEADQSLRWSRFLFPPAVLSMGALDWTLFSGMENAFHLGVWGLCLWLTLRAARAPSARVVSRRLWATGIAGALLVATRPESAVCVAAFGFYAAWALRRRDLLADRRAILGSLLKSGLPAVSILLLQAGVNRLLTGEASANGAIAKLFLNNPFMTTADRWERYKSLVGYVVPRLLGHHFAERAYEPLGYLVPAIGLVPLLTKRSRPIALLLWGQALAWLAVVSLNNQIRWHNERYAMPTVALVLLLAAVGLSLLAVREPDAPWQRLVRLLRGSYPLRAGLALALASVYWFGQAPRVKDQTWFFGRACRNILDQHVTAGLILKKMGVQRVLVGDAGALTYVSDRPGLDLIGLGGYH
ncbi:MAG: hypothetical protein KC731_13880, partial [Myxococcales bacterium]|nr:hypothetical protein [Myxococcales bacterium]